MENKLVTIADYLAECERVANKVKATRNKREKRNRRKYLHRLVKEIQTFDKHKGTNYGKEAKAFLI